MDTFHETILKIVRSVPSGHVVSYGQVAAYTGNPKASREVGWAMQTLGSTPDFPWWRVLNSAGKISLEGNPDASAELQQRLLEKEGVEFVDSLQLDIERYRYRPNETTLQAIGLDPAASSEAVDAYSLKQPPLL